MPPTTAMPISATMQAHKLIGNLRQTLDNIAAVEARENVERDLSQSELSKTWPKHNAKAKIVVPTFPTDGNTSSLNDQLVKACDVSLTGSDSAEKSQKQAKVIEDVKRMLEDNGDPNHRLFGWTAMMNAAYHGHLEVVDTLLNSGARINDTEQPMGRTALMFASTYGHAQIVQLLLDRGADPDPKDANGSDAMYCARRKAFPEIITMLQELGAGSDMEDASIRGEDEEQCEVEIMLYELNIHSRTWPYIKDKNVRTFTDLIAAESELREWGMMMGDSKKIMRAAKRMFPDTLPEVTETPQISEVERMLQEEGIYARVWPKLEGRNIETIESLLQAQAHLRTYGLLLGDSKRIIRAALKVQARQNP